jgi:hypothetical protein
MATPAERNVGQRDRTRKWECLGVEAGDYVGEMHIARWTSVDYDS